MSVNYKQLLLFDCDGGRASLFDDKTILSEIPSNCDCYLFWNDNDSNLSNKINYLKSYRQIHLYPVLESNSKNATDGKLIYFLGKLVDKYSFIIIIHGGDGIYKEIIRTVSEEYGNDRISNEIFTNPTPRNLRELLRQFRQRNQEYGYIEKHSSNNEHEDNLIDKSKNRCLLCWKFCNNFEDFYQHFRDKHHLRIKLICNCKLEFDHLLEFHNHQRKEQSNAFSNKGVAQCLAANQPTKVYLDPHPLILLISAGKTNKCIYCKNKDRSLDPIALISHLTAKHMLYNDIRFQCCSDTKRTLDRFQNHTSTQHKIVDIKKHNI
ncbi:unnamed protein product [Adineta ricciae]|uniref:Uncharacterized protein n=1 Tax=Adineta ricciae TaxID=249248 RepID=A0A815Y8W6_ADIRI|nr:unnamed protein product [Adineta ricciae]CAF1567534.1 unnamed protein product [Adineta ricciae]